MTGIIVRRDPVDIELARRVEAATGFYWSVFDQGWAILFCTGLGFGEEDDSKETQQRLREALMHSRLPPIMLWLKSMGIDDAASGISIRSPKKASWGYRDSHPGSVDLDIIVNSETSKSILRELAGV